MSRPGNPYDNAKAESCMKTLKAEEADGTAYADLEDARARIGAFIEDVYTADRLHSVLGYKSPVALEAAIRNTADRNQQPLTALSPNYRVSPRGCSPRIGRSESKATPALPDFCRFFCAPAYLEGTHAILLRAG